MHPVQHFKANFDHPEEVGLETVLHDVAVADGIQLHDVDTPVRNICFVWEDGRKAFFNYAYLISVDLLVNDSTNVLLLCFGSYTVILKGHRLSLLFDLLLDHQPKIITASNPRYLIDEKEGGVFVTDVQIKGD